MFVVSLSIYYEYTLMIIDLLLHTYLIIGFSLSLSLLLCCSLIYFVLERERIHYI